MTALLQDFRSALRTLVRSSTFTCLAVLILGLGIGASTAVFSTLNAVIFRPLLFPKPEQLIQVVAGDPTQAKLTFMLSGQELVEYRTQNQVFESIAGFRNRRATFSDGQEPTSLSAVSVSAGYFRVLGVRPLMGRAFQFQDENRAGLRRVIISHGFWQSYAGGDLDVLGTMLRINRTSYEVVGVMPARLRHVEGEQPQLFFPIPLDNQEALLARWLTVIARLKPDVTLERSQGEMSVLANRIEEKLPERNQGWTTRVIPLREQFVGDTNPMLFAVFGAVFQVLLIACANVANLVLIRALGREREIVVRSTLGASRLRLTRQLVIESLLLASGGALLGLVLASFSVNAFVPLLPQNASGMEVVLLDGRILLFTLGITLVSALLVGLAPALHTFRRNLGASLNDSEAGRRRLLPGLGHSTSSGTASKRAGQSGFPAGGRGRRKAGRSALA